MKRRAGKLRKNSYHYLALQILSKTNSPMKLKDLSNKILMIKSSGKTPYKTINAAVSTSDFIIKTAHGTYKLAKDYKF